MNITNHNHPFKFDLSKPNVFVQKRIAEMRDAVTREAAVADHKQIRPHVSFLEKRRRAGNGYDESAAIANPVPVVILGGRPRRHDGYGPVQRADQALERSPLRHGLCSMPDGPITNPCSRVV